MRKYLILLFLFGSFLALSCGKKSPGESTLTDPSLAIFYVSESIIFSDESPVFFMVRVSDPQGLEDILEVTFELAQDTALINAGLMWDDGQNGDIIPNNGTYTYFVIPKESAFSIGKAVVSFQVKDRENHLSPVLTDTVLVESPVINDPPVITQVAGPDTLSRSQGGTYLLTATVTDQQGLADIQKVTFNTFKPDGSPSSGNPFSMYDTGSDGDALAGDGIYSFQFTISNSNVTGQYRFEFQAQDKSGATSNVAVHIITVIQ